MGGVTWGVVYPPCLRQRCNDGISDRGGGPPCGGHRSLRLAVLPGPRFHDLRALESEVVDSRLSQQVSYRTTPYFQVNLILKTVDGRALQNNYKAGVDLQTGMDISTMIVMDWNGVELVAGDVISLGSPYDKVFVAPLAGSQKLAWQSTQTKPETRFVLRKVEGADGSPIASGDRVRLQLFGEKDSYLSSNAELVEPLLRADAPYMSGGPVRISFGPPLICGADEEVGHFLARIRQALIAQIDLDQPLPRLRRDLKFHLCQLFWTPTTWIIFKLLDWFRPGNKR